MRVLVDTHVFLLLQTEPERLGATIKILEDPTTQVHLSAASTWEMSIKWALGRLPLPQAPSTYIPDRMRRSQIEGLTVQHQHAVAVADLPLHHRDPFDRMLVAQANVERMALVTADPALDAYDVELIRVAGVGPTQ